MGRARDISKVFSTNTALATDSEISAFNYLTQASASTVYQTKSATGLILLTPTSITATGGSGSIGTNGTVSFTSTSSISLNTIFNSSYNNYRILVDITSNSANDGWHFLKLRSGTTDASTTYYYAFWARTHAGFDVSQQGNNVSSFKVGQMDNSATGYQGYFIDLIDPFTANKTKMGHYGSAITDSSVVQGFAGGGVHDVSSSYDGFSLISENGNITGSISVYGYNK
jgi:hypothetical protein